MSDWESGANEPLAGALLAALLLAGVNLDGVLEPSVRDYLLQLWELLPPEKRQGEP